MAGAREVTEILARVSNGDGDASAALLVLLYEELRGLAHGFFRRRSPGQTLQPTALVHEVYLKLTRGRDIGWESRAHFLAVAARAMRQILANHAERRRAKKRGGGRARVTLSGLGSPPRPEEQVDLIDLDDALAKLAAVSSEQARAVEMRFLAGVSEEEIALALDVSTRTVRRHWRMARAFLKAEMSGEGPS
jgi:RNA polymerase sigma factor (TIGR02999 family)